MANIITVCRILCSLALLFTPAFSAAFYALYLTAGFTDMIDGTVARISGGESPFGARLDSAADLCFFAAAAYKLLPRLSMPTWLWIWAALIAALKLYSAVFSLIKYRRPLPQHTRLNKLTGLLLFLLPLSRGFIEPRCTAASVCAIATAAAAWGWRNVKRGVGVE